MKVQQGGRWSAGIATPAADLTKDLGLDHCRLLLIQLIQTLSHFFETSTALFFFLLSWAVTSEGVVRSRGQQEYRVSGLEVTLFASSLEAHAMIPLFSYNLLVFKLYSIYLGRRCARVLL